MCLFIVFALTSFHFNTVQGLDCICDVGKSSAQMCHHGQEGQEGDGKNTEINRKAQQNSPHTPQTVGNKDTCINVDPFQITSEQ